MGGDPGRGERGRLNELDGAFVRRAGSATLTGGRRMTWSVADGRRGRRWRSVTTSDDGRLEAALLVETLPDGRLAKLELATGHGLLTLHPDGRPVRLHGNIARAAGIEHVELAWSDRHALLVDASPITAAVAVAGPLVTIGVGEGASVPAVEVATDLSIRLATWRVARTGVRRWWLVAADGGPSLLLETDLHGIPAAPDGVSWPLEREAAG